MSIFVLQDHGGGRFSLSGRMTFDTAGQILRESEIPFEEHTRIEVDLSGVDETDSAGLALLLEWITWANHTVREIRFTDMPEKISAIARTTEVEHLLRRGERWAGFIDAPGP
ncbi:MAG: STAS domain-containing protein [Gammaproteobacteria bacterium]|nr:STAS domain-containing protein [Pseudomonadota bacterium]MCH8307717.1 STAS domain-containing protein [Pseudomonadota bacterium]TDJ11283.1 MAG: STAS domain-containing protein [Gammaproteobacteria bacterium]